MKLQNHPYLCAGLCLCVVLACAATPAVFLAATDAASFNTIETVADPYTAPTPTAEDYYILRQLAARAQNGVSEPVAEPAEIPRQGPKLYISAAKNLSTMDYADEATRTEVLDALNRLAACGAVPQDWVDQLSKYTDDGAEYRYGGVYYDLNMAFCSVDSLGFVTVRWFDGQGQDLYTRASVTIDSRTGTVVEVWFSLPADSAPPVQLPDEDALRAFAAQAGLEGLGDWAAPADSSYTCALYSANGSALIAASTHPYTVYDADRCYYSLTLQAEM